LESFPAGAMLLGMVLIAQRNCETITDFRSHAFVAAVIDVRRLDPAEASEAAARDETLPSPQPLEKAGG
jgi:hypothetical protein